MVADELACDLASVHVKDGDRVLDLFCGSGRLLAAAENASLRVGFDVNPLACLLTRAKLAEVQAGTISDVLGDMARGRITAPTHNLRPLDARKVEWFDPETWRELGRVVSWINAMGLLPGDRLLVTAALSATVRDVSYARRTGWKLHRLGRSAREAFSACPWERLDKRLRYCMRELHVSLPPSGTVKVELGDARDILTRLAKRGTLPRFDVVLTSPPYGDSRTTVQYGAASALCLAVVKDVFGFEEVARTGGTIDACCLGGRSRAPTPLEDLSPYWCGDRASHSGRSVDRFLADYGESCDAAAESVAPGGKAVFVVGNRSVSGKRLHLDRFTSDRLAAAGMRLVASNVRPLLRKHIPSLVNRFARAKLSETRDRGVAATMTSETILELEKPPPRHRSNPEIALSRPA